MGGKSRGSWELGAGDAGREEQGILGGTSKGSWELRAGVPDRPTPQGK